MEPVKEPFRNQKRSQRATALDIQARIQRQSLGNANAVLEVVMPIWVRAAIRSMRYLIETAAKRHAEVRVIVETVQRRRHHGTP